MTEFIIRIIFLLASAGIGFQAGRFAGLNLKPERPEFQIYGLLAGIVVALVFILIEVLISKRPIQSIGAIVFGLIVGCLLAVILSYILQLGVIDLLANRLDLPRESARQVVPLALAVLLSYLFVMIIYKTRDRFRFIIPYVEFQREEKGTRPIVVDTSAVIDGRLPFLCEARLFDTTLIVPKFVLQELQHVADSSDRLRRNRGRRGLEMLQRMQHDERLAIQVHDARMARGSTVDSKLVSLAGQLQARILTCDYNLGKFAELQNVDVINLNDLANALRPTVMQGEEVSLRIIRPGDEQGQGVGYLNDGTMVVIEQGRERIGQTVNIVVTNTLQTSAGRMVFGRVRSEHPAAEEKDGPNREKEKETKEDGK